MTTQQMSTEKDHYLAAFDREYEITMRLLRAYPAAKSTLKVNDRLRDAMDLATMFTISQNIAVVSLGDTVMPSEHGPRPASWDALLSGFQAAHAEAMTKLRAMSPEAMNGMITIPVGPKQIGQMRRGDALWMFLYDTIHHRGQFSVYARIAGAKVPSIYGPTADEPWM
jgi:uncharacterized damage-inducible protein DinB